MSFYEWNAEDHGYFFFKRQRANMPSHFHGAPEFLFVFDGEEEVTVNGETRVLKKGDGAFSDGFFPHAYTPKTADTLAYALLGDREYFERVFSLFGGKTPPRFFKFENFELLETLRLLCADKTQKDGGRVAMETGAIAILIAEIAKNNSFIPRAEVGQTALVCKILQYAETHLFEDVRLVTLSKVFGYSHEHLSRVLHAHLRESWNAYVGRLRARKARGMLKSSPEKTVLQIAFDCGFDSANTFYRAYKKEFGVPPKQNR
ncbi:MAG: AraC family transcriptional regulator [Clostridia bacterium]|nr:AraC family transcriptional regulator [Clostridia bacterium]